MIRAFLVEDHELMRRGLELMFAGIPDIELTGCAGSAASLMSLLPGLELDILLLDPGLPDADGPELIHKVHTLRPNLPILILTAQPEDAAAARLFDAGASGYVSKAVSPETLAQAVRRVAGGKRYVSPQLAEILMLRTRSRSELDALPPREYQVLCYLADGLRTNDIAVRMGVTPQSVSTWRRRLLDRLGLESPGELYVWAAQHLDPDADGATDGAVRQPANEPR